MANFKGQNEWSVYDVVSFWSNGGCHRPAVIPFMNLMETHLPFWAPANCRSYRALLSP